MRAAFRVGDRVKKLRGYAFPGVIVSVFRTCADETRYVVELVETHLRDEELPTGLLHIFSEANLARRTD